MSDFALDSDLIADEIPESMRFDFDARQYEFKEISIDKELAKAYSEAVTLRQTINDNADKIPPNQVAQVNLAALKIIELINRERNKLYDANRVRQLEMAIKIALEDTTTEVKDRFFKKMEELAPNTL